MIDLRRFSYILSQYSIRLKRTTLVTRYYACDLTLRRRALFYKWACIISSKSAFSVLVHFSIIGKNMGRRKRPITPHNTFFLFDCRPLQSFGNLRYGGFRKNVSAIFSEIICHDENEDGHYYGYGLCDAYRPWRNECRSWINEKAPNSTSKEFSKMLQKN